MFPGSNMIPKNAIQQSPEQVRERKKQLAVRLLKKVLMNKCREHFKQIRGNAWAYYNHRQQKKMKATMQLFKVMSMLQEKIKLDKMVAVAKIKGAGQISTNNSGSNQDNSHSSFSRLVK